VVIIGSSFIGMEVASIAAKRANVTVVGIEKVRDLLLACLKSFDLDQ